MSEEKVVLNREEVLKSFLEHKDEINKRCDEGIEKYRKGDFKIFFKDKRVKRVTVKQKTHKFLFGCNAFMLDSFESADKEKIYKEEFANLFNQAVVPFYWSSLEVEEGKLRFRTDSENVYRRPAPDTVLNFCKERNIEPKGHCLLWSCMNPEWLEKYSVDERKRLVEKRFKEIADEYADKIPSWDIANESATNYNAGLPYLFEEWDEIALKLGGKYFPNNIKILNDTNTGIWYSYPRQGKYMPFNMQLKEFLNKKLPIDEIGIQFHLFCRAEILKDSCFMKYENIVGVLDILDKYDLPINLSEITIPSFPDRIKENESVQAELTEIFYKLFFALKNMKSIVWWNMVDGYAAYAQPDTYVGENYYCAGLLNYDMTKKEAFYTLDRLINKEWKTNLEVELKDGELNFRGFYGDYEITVYTEQGSEKYSVSLNCDGDSVAL